MSIAAQVASVVGCLGLAALLLARRRAARLAGLVAWGAGLGVLGVYLLPDLSPARLAAAAVGGLVLAVGLAFLLRYRPYALAFATLACIPLRLPVDIGRDEVNLLLPLYAVIGGLALSLAWSLTQGGRPGARARAHRSAGRRVRRLDRPLNGVDRRRSPRSDPPRGLHPAVRAPGDRLRTAPLARALAHVALERARRDGARLRGGRRLPVGDPRRVLESERQGVQRLRALLPGELGVLGPVRVRALPHRRDPRLARGDPARRRSRLAHHRPVRGRRRHVARAAHLVLAVELRRARRGHRRRGRRRLGTRGRRSPSSRSAPSPRRCCSPSHRSATSWSGSRGQASTA